MRPPLPASEQQPRPTLCARWARCAQATITGLDQGIKSLGSGGEGAGGAPLRKRELPALPVLFSMPVEPIEEVDDIDYLTDE